MTFDPFKQAKIQNSYNNLSSVKIPEQDMSLDELKRLSGIDAVPAQRGLQNQQDKAAYMRDNNIKPGTPAWFKLWFAKPELTGEDPYSK